MMDRYNIGLCIFIMLIMMLSVNAYDSDYLGLADYSSILFVDTNNSACSNSHTRTQAMNGSTPWCDLSGFLTYNLGVTDIEGGDTIYILAGNYNTFGGEYRFGNKEFNSDVTITSYPDNAVNIYSYVTALASVPNALWENQSNSSHNLWNTSLTAMATAYPTFYANGSKFVNDKYWDYAAHNDSSHGVSFLDSTRSYDRTYTKIANELWIRFNDLTINPNNVELHVANQAEVIRFQHISGIGTITISDITFKNSYYGVRLDNLSNFVVDSITLSSGYGGVRISNGCENITIQNCNFTGGWEIDSWYHDIIKQSYEENSAIYSTDAINNITIQHNNIEYYGGGILLDSASQYEVKNAMVYNNTLRYCVGSTLEIEDYCINSTWSYNKVYDSWMGLSLGPAQSIDGSECEFHHNEIKLSDYIIYNETINYSTYALKVYAQAADGANVSFWNVHHNTFIGKGKGFNGLINYLGIHFNSTWENNIFYSWSSGSNVHMTGEANNGVFFDHNLYYNAYDGAGLYFYRWNNDSDTTGFYSLADALASANWDGTWDINSKDADPQFWNLSDFDLRPTLGSIACTMSDTGSYVGALNCINIATPHLNLYSGQKLELYSGSHLKFHRIEG